MEAVGALAGILSSAIGGSSIGATRYLASAADPVLIGVFRFGIGALLMLPLAWMTGGRWPEPRDHAATVALGLLFFGVFPVLFNAALIFTTAARGALALSTLPLLTMLLGALIGIEPLDARKAIGVVVAMLGVAVALASGLATVPPLAWWGDVLMIAAASCMAFYTVLSRGVIRRSDPLTFTAIGMAAGALALATVAAFRGSFGAIGGFAAPQWWALAYLGVFGGALTFYLWSLALRHATPTRVAVSVTVNPLVAALFGAMLLDEPVQWNLFAGMAAVAVGIWIAVARPASSDAREST